MTNPTAAELIARSNRLGADPRNTNYAGGNTSAKGVETDPVTGEPVELLWVKGSGGDLGTLTEQGLAVLRLDRLRAMVDTYPGVEREDEMVAAFDYALHGKGGAAPSIDTAMHGLVDAAHVDHLHPDSGIAIATAADGPELTERIFGDQVVWVPWRRPGFQLGLDIAEIKAANPQAVGCILGGHGITAWGDTSDEAERNSLWIIDTAAAYLAEHGASEPFGAVVPGYESLPPAERRAKAAALAPTIRGLASVDKPQVGHFTDSDVVLEFLSREKLAPLAALGTSCPDHFLRTKVRPLVLDLPADASIEASVARLKELHAEYRADYAAYYERYATPAAVPEPVEGSPASTSSASESGSSASTSSASEGGSPAMRGADPAIVLVPGVGMFSFGKDKQTARVAGEFYVNAINVMRGAESVSTYAPISDEEKFRIEYWALEEAKLARMPRPKSHATRVALVTGAASGIGKAIATRLAAEGACVVIADLDLEKAQAAAAELGSSDVAIGVAANVTDAAQVQAAIDEAVLAFGGLDLIVNNAGLSLSKPLLETTEADWDLQHDVMAKGSFLVSKAAARVLIDQGMGGDIVYISSKNSVFAGPNNIAYSATKADQAHQVRLLAVELGEYGVRVNGVNPDGVVRGSGIFASGWGANRAATYGVPEEKLGEFYAQRTILKREVLPEHVANAVYVLTGPELSHTTGLHVPVDAGVAAAFLR
ncbi:bifunctional aldolase/short-chain dehydrogenase [Agromyces larvae]|uniref:Bifunctional aldolase/short-chain dehydrogenase n=1 Tax=Agromyces larvae TaxID=2929802 RepID=A0ABY4C484_9MICO|nr:bifunctional aldolase/short-chain dehydrogenase [Agromyces larvae]UOE46173.1 bifunctional aldolase/short-chain dehydrogenase [Agromyces larvae]